MVVVFVGTLWLMNDTAAYMYYHYWYYHLHMGFASWLQYASAQRSMLGEQAVATLPQQWWVVHAVGPAGQ